MSPHRPCVLGLLFGRGAGAQELYHELQAVNRGPRLEVVELGRLLLAEEPPAIVLVENAFEAHSPDGPVPSGWRSIVDPTAIAAGKADLLGCERDAACDGPFERRRDAEQREAYPCIKGKIPLTTLALIPFGSEMQVEERSCSPPSPWLGRAVGMGG